ncbi:hypothetical protein DRP07_05750 [Archaeoglobales archaeon]|nr:MAG: hypothetical protein DRP07_05750 [Archaeoglobales archaeon]
MPELQQKNKHLIIKSRKAVVVAEISDGKILRVYCDNWQRCNEAGILKNGCPAYCEFIIAIKQHLKGKPSKFSIKEL